jgi:N-methylhydantoinase B
VLDAREAIFAQSERRDRESIEAIADGTYTADGCLDNDGLSDEPHWVRVTVDVAGDEMTIDLTRSGDAARGPINCGEAQAVSACRVAYKILVNPLDPVTGGTFRPLSVRVRQGSLMGAQEPSACGWYFSCLGLVMDLVAKALASAIPERVAAANYGDSENLLLSGPIDRRGERFIDWQTHVGGWGGWSTGDGESGLINHVNGGLRNVPIEVVESKLPVRVVEYRLRRDSGGAGRFRGGLGQDILIESESERPIVASFMAERTKFPAPGLAGGTAGGLGDVRINGRRIDNRKQHVLVRGDRVLVRTPGGGGYGPPRQRDRRATARDRALGYTRKTGAG